VVEAWPQVVGPVIARYTLNTYIYNQTLFVRLSNPALRSDLSMMRTELVKKLNDVAGQQIIVDIRFN
jgi:predicted nucleic acid-binding Zn ribbon protein